MTHSREDGKFKFNKKGKLKNKERAEIKRTSTNIFDWFSSGIKNIEKTTTESIDTAAREAKKHEIVRLGQG